MDILFVIQSTAIGGITTSLFNLIEYIDAIDDNRFNIDIFTFANNSNIEFPKSTNVMEANENLILASTSFYDVIKSGNLLSIIKRIFLMLKVRMIGSDKFYRCEFNKLDKLKQYDVAISRGIILIKVQTCLWLILYVQRKKLHGFTLTR